MLGGRDAVGTSREASGGSKKVMTFEAASEGKRNKFWKWHPGTGEKGIYMMIKGKGSENSMLGIGIKAGDSRGMQAIQRRMNSVLWERGSQWELQNWKASFIKGEGWESLWRQWAGQMMGDRLQKKGLQKKSTTVTNILHATFTSTKWVSWLQNETTRIWIHHSLYNVYIS